MRTVDDIFTALGGLTEVSRILGKRPSTASEMKRRGSIPVRHWPRLVEAAREAGIPLTNDTLVRVHTSNTEAAA